MPRDRRERRKGEEGHLMAGLMVAVAILAIFSSLAYQGWEDVLRRDKEAEMIFRAQEIVRGIHRHRKAMGRLPEKLEDLMKPGPKGEYLLRHRYKDPLVKGGKWGLLYVGPGGTIIDPSIEPALDENQAATGLKPLFPGSKKTVMGAEGGNGALDLPKTGGFDEEDQEADGTGKPKHKSIVERNQGPTGMSLAGVKSTCEDSPFRYYKGLMTYAEWRFTYDELEAPRGAGQGGPGAAGAPAQPTGAGAGRGGGGLNGGQGQGSSQRGGGSFGARPPRGGGTAPPARPPGSSGR